jgi:hypothetical protein
MIPDFLVVVGSYVGVFILATLVFNFLMAGFLRTYMVVKGSRGAKVLVQVVTVARNYYRTGYIEDGFLVYKSATKHEKRLSIPLDINVFYRSLNITCISVDEELNTIILPNGRNVTGFDAEKYNNLYLRTLYRPAILDPKQQLMFVLTIINTIAILITLGVLMFLIGKKVDVILANTEAIKTYFVGLNATIL